MKRPTVTVFIGTTNRLSTLERTIKSYFRLTTPHELVIVDNGTDNLACLSLLTVLGRKGIVAGVYHLPHCEWMDEVAVNFVHAIDDWKAQGRGGEWFAVSEADVSFEATPPDALERYIQLANMTGRAVGPHLRVDEDIPVTYPLRSRVLACETWMQYRRDMVETWISTPGREQWANPVWWSDTQIDTTFHLFPRDRPFRRLHMDPIRVGRPYDALHLDWYLDVFNPVPENEIYMCGLGAIGSWGRSWLRDYWLWFQEHGAEKAWEMLLREPMNLGDLCNVSFIRSWCLQYGVGVPRDIEASKDWLRSAIPFPNDRYWDLKGDWMRFVYDNDLSALGWSEQEVAA